MPCHNTFYGGRGFKRRGSSGSSLVNHQEWQCPDQSEQQTYPIPILAHYGKPSINITIACITPLSTMPCQSRNGSIIFWVSFRARESPLFPRWQDSRFPYAVNKKTPFVLRTTSTVCGVAYAGPWTVRTHLSPNHDSPLHVTTPEDSRTAENYSKSVKKTEADS